MGMFTNKLMGATSSLADEFDVSPIESFDERSETFIDLSMRMVAENTEMVNSFNKAIGIQEAVAMSEHGTVEAFYESVNLSGIVEKVKSVIKAIIAKIQKLLHTFVAKLHSIFGNNKTFAKKYKKEIIAGWSNVKSDWEFKGYKFFTNDYCDIKPTEDKNTTALDTVNDLNISTLSIDGATTVRDLVKKNVTAVLNTILALKSEITTFADNMNNDKESAHETARKLGATFAGIKSDKLDDCTSTSEYLKSLFMALRDGEESKVDLTKSDINDIYGNMGGLLSSLEDDKTVTKKMNKWSKNLDTFSKNVDKWISKLNDEVLKQGDAKRKEGDTADALSKEQLVGAIATIQAGVSEVFNAGNIALSALLTAWKDYISQGKAIAVKVIGQSKKMTEESYDYSSSYNEGSSFLDSVQII